MIVEFCNDFEIKNLIRSKSFSPVYVFFGAEQYLIKNTVEKIISSVVTSNEEFNLSRFEGNASLQSIYDAVTSFPLMSPNKAVLLSDFPIDKANQSDFDKLITAIEDMPPTTVFILRFETVEIDPKKPSNRAKKLFETVEAAEGKLCHFEQKTTAELVKVLQAGAAKRNCTLEKSTAIYLIENCSSDLNMLRNELEKLCGYVGSGVIDSVAVDAICTRSVEAKIYDLSKAILRRDLKTALKITDNLFFLKTKPLVILSNLSSAYVDLYRAYCTIRTGGRIDDSAKAFGYGARAFVLKNAERSLSNLTETQIQKSLSLISECDFAIKSSRTAPKILIEKLMTELVGIISVKK